MLYWLEDPRRLIPFDTYNLFYRDDLERPRLEPLRNGMSFTNAKASLVSINMADGAAARASD
jgi:hypothetical protein